MAASIKCSTLNIICIEDAKLKDNHKYVVICRLNHSGLETKRIAELNIESEMFGDAIFTFGNDTLYIFSDKTDTLCISDDVIYDDLPIEQKVRRAKCIAKFALGVASTPSAALKNAWKLERNPTITEQDVSDIKTFGCYARCYYGSSSITLKIDWNMCQCRVKALAGKSIKIKTYDPKTAKIENFALPKSFSTPILIFVS
ncbi:MAG: hypothetical protein M0R33_18995 [Methylomonas sp.]|jgi:hypothetical protein|uniref:hypothetical protein n=1 Tax=Methylomonas sp. TaxID=418 RepID=UPI0025D5CAAD|nr:hypothetical protein [Methylomonas sp.]MCK9608533.1 hypothetical protein [Methylomonas sp.]